MDLPPVLGFRALEYCSFEFHGDGSWEFTRPDIADSEDELEADPAEHEDDVELV